MPEGTSEHSRFQEAVAEFTAHPNTGPPIRTMIGLAMEAENSTIRRWASTWLKETCNILVVFEDKGTDHAAPTEAAHIR